VKIYWNTISKELKKILENISNNSDFSDFYLVGGTALSLYLGHRKSVDLDFFSEKEFYPSILTSLNYPYRSNIVSKNSIDIDINGAKVFFMYFSFPRYKKIEKFKNLKIASLIDIALMKLIALQGRFVLKDIIDLYFVHSKVVKIRELLKIFDKLYSTEKLNKLENFSNLFDKNILSQPAPIMLKPINLEKALEVLQNEVAYFYKNVT